jgi:hypothetical protein
VEAALFPRFKEICVKFEIEHILRFFRQEDSNLYVKIIIKTNILVFLMDLV